VLPYLGLFFKDPMGCTEHRLDRQFDHLMRHVCAPR
jgi:hypothetical protein